MLKIKNHKYWLFWISFLDSIIAIIPTDLLVVYYFLKYKKASVWLQSLMIAFGSVLGSLVLYFLSVKIISFFPDLTNSLYYFKIKDLLNQNHWFQIFYLIFFISTSLIPFSLISVFSGLFLLPLWVFVLAVYLGRFLRFWVISYFTKTYGQKVLEYVGDSFYEKISQFFSYWYQKKNEIFELSYRDLIQAKIIAIIKLFKTKTQKKFIDLDKIIFLHPIDRGSALDKLNARKKIVKKYLEKHSEINKIDLKTLNKILPSITDINVVKIEDEFLVWEGNGRIRAIQEVLKENQRSLKIEVVEYLLSDEGYKELDKKYQELLDWDKKEKYEK